jgi:hypothetical protein
MKRDLEGTVKLFVYELEHIISMYAFLEKTKRTPSKQQFKRETLLFVRRRKKDSAANENHFLTNNID